MREIYKLLLVLLVLSAPLLAQESFTKPAYDVRLDRDSEAREWYDNADTDSDSAYNIGLTYDIKINNNTLAEFWYKRALNIDKNNISAIFNLGIIYEDEKKYNEAIKYYEKADLLKHKNGAYNIALIYEEYLRSYLKAVKWYKKAIERESLSALKNLSLLYHKEFCDNVKAVEYFLPLINNRYSKEKVMKFFKVKYKLDEAIIQKDYEAQLKSQVIPEKLKYKGGI